MTVRVIKKRKATGAKGAPVAVTPARWLAYNVLGRVETEGAFASVLLASATEALRVEDRALCYELVLGVLRWQLWLDTLMAHYAGRAVAEIDAPVRRALRLGLYQLRFLSRVPASAAVNESVNLAHAARLGGAAGFINAVLRRATREPERDPATGVREELERLAISTSHPAWLLARWIETFGVAEATALARANNQAPPVAFRINEWRAERADVQARLAAAGVEMQPSEIAPGAWRVAAGTGGAALRALARAGLIYTQDEASQLVAHVLGAEGGERVLDVCAAPGSKATHVAGLAEDRALVVAGDIYEHRLRVVVEAAGRQQLTSIHAVAFDAEQTLPFADRSFARVLVDAPCTGTGTLRHNPEIRWRLTPADIVDLAARQRRILTNAARVVRPGGRLVYSTCSVEPAENEAVFNDFLAAQPDFVAAQLTAPAHLLTTDGAVRTWPHRGGADGFFMAACVRRS
ncbi:MAG TPA: 16S rRNA (cytosine(967)-C(5))-methyltransferase RsmB [Pyrinomonadaceae bacterium]|jgi:16S rRNA (cytosine967-C5)-methyltransferase